uniref:PXA domain-containing protein n=1 Tax=Melanopsichium pennsylvanicum 4 TaxID=1398559 RepID=A0A077R6S5_9BASI|nr:putative protein [Melanopsichium pennsylvanicum 4]
MTPEAIRRDASSPSPLSSPTPSAVAAFALRKDTSSPFTPSAAFRDVASPLSASHASLTTDPVHATLSPRPMSPVAYRIEHSTPPASSSAKWNGAYTQDSANQSVAHQVSIKEKTNQTWPSTSLNQRSTAVPLSTASRDDKATDRAFYRRILFQDLPASSEAPTITHDAHLDHEIYLLLAFLLRETVLPWYSKLTPDRQFLTQVTSIIISILHTVAQRQSDQTAISVSTTALDSDIHAPSISSAQLPRIHDLLSRDIPLILRQHFYDFRQAHIKVDSVWAPLGTQQSSSPTSNTLTQAECDQQRRQRLHERLPSHVQEAINVASRSDASPLQVAQLFYAASPHPGFDPLTSSLDGKIDLAYLRIVVLNLLSSLLPADEYAPNTERFILRDVLVTVLRGALARSFRPWFFVRSIHKALDSAGWPSDPALLPDRSSYLESEVGLCSDTLAPNSGSVATIEASLYPDRFTSQKGNLPPSFSAGSLYERKMHGRYPSRKFNFSHDDTITAQGRSSAIDANLTLTQSDIAVGSGKTGKGVIDAEIKTMFDERDLAPNYVGNWLNAAEEVLQVDSHVLLRATFGLARTILCTTGLDESVNRMVVRRINKELRDTQKLTKMVRELRRTLLPNGHFAPSVPDPDVETQEAEWIRLRTRLIFEPKVGEIAFLPWLIKKMLLGSADVSVSSSDLSAYAKDTQIQVQRLTTWLEPLCSTESGLWMTIDPLNYATPIDTSEMAEHPRDPTGLPCFLLVGSRSRCLLASEDCA